MRLLGSTPILVVGVRDDSFFLRGALYPQTLLNSLGICIHEY